MQYISTEDKQLQLLQSIERRLAQSTPLFEDLSPQAQRAVFFNAVANASFEEIYELEQTHEACIARRQAIAQVKMQARLTAAKQAGQAGQTDFDQAVERVSKQLENEVRMS